MTMGSQDDAALLVTDALLASLNRREVRGVLAHEIAHIRANDVWLASLAGSMRRVTGGLALAGGLGLLLALPALALGAIGIPLPLVLLLLAAADAERPVADGPGAFPGVQRRSRRRRTERRPARPGIRRWRPWSGVPIPGGR